VVLSIKLLLGGFFRVHIGYVYLRGNNYYYQRKIPRDLLHRYGGSKHIKVNLKTNDLKQVAKQVSVLNKQYESTWASLRNNPELKPSSVHGAAIKLFSQFGLKSQPSINEDSGIDQFVDTLQQKREAYAQGDEDAYLNSSLEDFLDPVEVEALRLIKEEPKFRLSDALEVYLNGHAKKNNEKFCTYARRAWNRLIEVIGDKEFVQIARADTNEFISKELERGSKTTTVERHISVIKAVFNVVIIERELSQANPFMKLRIPGLGEDSKIRGTFDSTQLSTLIHECKRKNDDIRWLLALQIDLGCSLSEVTGLALSDLRLNVGLSYVSFKPHFWRPLKTKYSTRNVPLVGVSLWAAYRIVESAKKGQRYAFPRYTNGIECKANYASDTLNKWIRSLGIGKTTQELRHTMRGRLRHTNAPKSIQDDIGGWGREDIGDAYGLGGEGLNQLKGWLEKVVTKD